MISKKCRQALQKHGTKWIDQLIKDWPKDRPKLKKEKERLLKAKTAEQFVDWYIKQAYDLQSFTRIVHTRAKCGKKDRVELLGHAVDSAREWST